MSNLPQGRPTHKSSSRSRTDSKSKSSVKHRVQYKTIVAVRKKKKKNSTPKPAGKRGKTGKAGKRGKRGPKGESGQGIVAFVSAVQPHALNNIRQGETVKSMLALAHSQIYYDDQSGIFTSHAGPGFYEIHFGGSWSQQASLALVVDGTEVNPHSGARDLATWSRETLIIHTTQPRPTFALANAKNAPAVMNLVISGSNSAAFITIKKIG